MTEVALTISIVALIYSIYSGQTSRQIELEERRQIFVSALFDSAMSLLEFLDLQISKPQDDPKHNELLKKLSKLEGDIINVRNTVIDWNFRYLFICSPIILNFVSMEQRLKETQKLVPNCIKYLKEGDLIKAERYINFLDLSLNKVGRKK